LTLDALKGVLANDVENPTCAAQAKPLKVTAWSTGSAGNVAVSAASTALKAEVTQPTRNYPRSKPIVHALLRMHENTVPSVR
jgi:hypothetical protein